MKTICLRLTSSLLRHYWCLEVVEGALGGDPANSLGHSHQTIVMLWTAVTGLIAFAHAGELGHLESHDLLGTHLEHRLATTISIGNRVFSEQQRGVFICAALLGSSATHA